MAHQMAVYCRVGSKEQAIDKKPEISNGLLRPTLDASTAKILKNSNNAIEWH